MRGLRVRLLCLAPFFSVKINGVGFNFTLKKGYCCIACERKKGDVVEIEMNMPVKCIKAHD